MVESVQPEFGYDGWQSEGFGDQEHRVVLQRAQQTRYGRSHSLLAAKLTISGTFFFEPTSVLKSTRIIQSIAASLSSMPDSTNALIAFASPDVLELQELWCEIQSDNPTDSPDVVEDT